MDIEAKDLAVFGIGPEDGADGVVRADLLQADLHARDVVTVDLGSIARLGNIAFCPGENAEELLFERDATFSEKLGRKLENTSGVRDDLDGFDTGDLVEEPAAAGIHQLGMALEFEQLQCCRSLGEVEYMAA